jgi:hypothetical protein
LKMKRRPSGNWVERSRLVGLILWRGGLAFVLGYAFYFGTWRLIRQFDWPLQVTAGLAIAAAGFGLLMLALILERIEASHREGNLRDD